MNNLLPCHDSHGHPPILSEDVFDTSAYYTSMCAVEPEQFRTLVTTCKYAVIQYHDASGEWKYGCGAPRILVVDLSIYFVTAVSL